MTKDNFKDFVDTPAAPAETCFPIVPDNQQELAVATKALFVGTGGDLALVPIRGTNPVIFRNVPSGSILDVRVRVVMATGTTATDIVGLA